MAKEEQADEPNVTLGILVSFGSSIRFICSAPSIAGEPLESSNTANSSEGAGGASHAVVLFFLLYIYICICMSLSLSLSLSRSYLASLFAGLITYYFH